MNKNDTIYKNIFNSISDGIITVSKTGKIIEVNTAFTKITGLKKEDVVGKRAPLLAKQLLSPKEIVKVLSKIPKFLAGEKIKNYEIEFNKKKLRIDRSYSKKDSNIVTAIIRDITESKMTENLIKESVEKYKTLFEETTDAIFITDAKTGILIDCNIAATKLVGRKQSEIIGKHQQILHPPQEKEGKYSKSYKQHLKEKEGQVLEAQIITKKGEIREVEIKAGLFEIGGKKHMQGIFRDITERKKAKEKVETEKMKLEVIMENMLDGISVLDTTGNVIQANRAFANMLGYEKAEQVIGKNMGEFTQEEDIPKVVSAMKEGFKKGVIKNLDVVGFSKYGKTYQSSINAALIKDDKGKPALLGVVRDITERKKIEDALKESEEKQKNLINNIPGMVYRGNADWSAEIISGSAEICGYTRDELNSMKGGWLNVIHPDYKKRVFDEGGKLTKEQRSIVQVYQIIDKKGVFRWVEDRKVAHFTSDNKFAGVDGIVFDITERKNADDELRLQSTIMIHMDEGVNLVRLDDGIIVYANPKFETMFGYSQGELTGKHVSIVNDPFEKDPKEKAEEILGILNKSGEWHGEIKNIRKDGTLFWSSANVTILDHPEYGKITISIHSDITERKNAEIEKEFLQTQLIQSQKMEAMGVLAGGVAHDFNNILTAIMGDTELLLEEESIEEKFKSDLKNIKVSTKRAAELVRQLLLFSRKEMVLLMPLSFNETVMESVKMLKRIIGEQISVKVDIPDEEYTVNADKGNINQILMNLAVNSRDAMPAGGKITISIRKCSLTKEETNYYGDITSGEYVRLVFEDTGIGMTEDIKDRIFEPFFTSKGIGKGTGLGLSVVLGIIQIHHAGIKVYSEPGKGTSVNIYFPIIKANNVDIDNKKDIQIIGNGEVIFVVEDELAIQNILRRIFRRNNYEGFFAGSITEAEEIYKKNSEKIDLVLSDMVLPDGTGIELVERLNRIKSVKKVIYSSGYLDDQSRWEEIQKNNIPFIQKPYIVKDLLDIIHDILE
ncbi:PAS domain S-box protein [Elusimicrobiota bacterium]